MSHGCSGQAFVLDPRRCIDRNTWRAGEWLPRELRPKLGTWIYGCDVCQDAHVLDPSRLKLLLLAPVGEATVGGKSLGRSPELPLMALDRSRSAHNGPRGEEGGKADLRRGTAPALRGNGIITVRHWGVVKVPGWVFWAIVGAAAIHVAEECLGGWLDWVQRFARISTRQFAVVNLAFLLLCIAGAVVGDASLVFSLSVASLLVINALLHIIGTLVSSRYSPGAVSAVVLYLPIALWAYYLAAQSGRLTVAGGLGSLALGALWMGFPIGFLLLRRRI